MPNELGELLEEPAPLGPAAHLTPWEPATITGTGGIVWAGGVWDTWYQWNTITTSTATTTNLIWNDWTAVSGNGYARMGTLTTAATAANWVLTPPVARSELARRTVEWSEIERQAAAARVDRDKIEAAAHVEGRALLEMILDASQLITLAAERFFDVVGASGQLWRVRYGTSGNVEAIDEQGGSIMRLCAHPRLRERDQEGYLPTEDVMAAQALHLVHDDSEFLRQANVHRGSRHSLRLVPALHNIDRVA